MDLLMDFEQILGRLTEIGTIEDDAERRAILTEVSDGVRVLSESYQNLTTENETLNADKRRLQEHNMQLYLKVSEQTKQKSPEEEETKTEDLKYEDLFNEKGEIK